MSVKEDGDEHGQSGKYSQHYAASDGDRQTFTDQNTYLLISLETKVYTTSIKELKINDCVLWRA